MKKSRKYKSFKHNIKISMLVLLCSSNQLFAAFEIRNYTLNNGGSEASSQRIKLSGSIAQVDASHKKTSTRYELSSGFWQQNTDLIFTNEFE